MVMARLIILPHQDAMKLSTILAMLVDSTCTVQPALVRWSTIQGTPLTVNPFTTPEMPPPAPTPFTTPETPPPAPTPFTTPETPLSAPTPFTTPETPSITAKQHMIQEWQTSKPIQQRMPWTTPCILLSIKKRLLQRAKHTHLQLQMRQLECSGAQATKI